MSLPVCTLYCAPDTTLGASCWGSVLQGIVLVVIVASAVIGLIQGILKTVEQAIKLLTIVLSIYEFDVGEFPDRARSAYSCMFK